MVKDQIAAVEIDESGRLHVFPSSFEFPLIYREAMEVHWDAARRSLHSPTPREWSVVEWFQQIQSAAESQGCKLLLASTTSWVNIPANVKDAILQVASHQ